MSSTKKSPKKSKAAAKKSKAVLKKIPYINDEEVKEATVDYIKKQKAHDKEIALIIKNQKLSDAEESKSKKRKQDDDDEEAAAVVKKARVKRTALFCPRNWSVSGFFSDSYVFPEGYLYPVPTNFFHMDA